MSRLLFGLETEYALFGERESGHERDRLAGAVELVHAVARRHPWLRDRSETGIFLANGARLYVDCGRHPELATPECASPWELVASVRAGDRILEAALVELAARGSGEAPQLTRCNVDYSGSSATWGSHESYLHRSDPVALGAQLVPHLVSRIVYAGAGGFDPLSPGVEFTLSPRAGYLVRERAKDSTTMRGLLHDRDEPHSGIGTRRLHLLCGESLCSEEALLVRVGATALVVALADAGERPGDAVALADPLAALRAFARDPSCRASVPLARGGTATALEIQRHFLERVEAAIGRGSLPGWAEILCLRWRSLLDRLARGPEAVAASLDWAIKWALYRRACPPPRRWEWLAAWTRALGELAAALAGPGGSTARALERLAAADEATRDAVALDLLPRLRREGLRIGELQAFVDARARLCETDFRFAQLGSRGVFARLDAAGRLAHRVVSAARVEHAIEQAPRHGRARARGEAVRELAGAHGARYVCDWSGIFDRSLARLRDLGDPFASRGEWRPAAAADWPGEPPASPVPVAELWPEGMTGVP